MQFLRLTSPAGMVLIDVDSIELVEQLVGWTGPGGASVRTKSGGVVAVKEDATEICALIRSVSEPEPALS